MQNLDNFHFIFADVVENAIVLDPQSKSCILPTPQTFNRTMSLFWFFTQVRLYRVYDDPSVISFDLLQLPNRDRPKDDLEHRRFIL